MDIDFTIDFELEDELEFTFDVDVETDETTDEIALAFTPDGDPRLQAWIADVYVEGVEGATETVSFNAVTGMEAAVRVQAWATWKYGALLHGLAMSTYADYEKAAA